MQRLWNGIAILVVVAALSAVIYARMSHNPPIWWGWLFALLIGSSFLGLFWVILKEKDE